MADAKTPPAEIIVRMAGQYIKDLSFENPNVHRLLQNQGDNPQINVNVGVTITKLNDITYETVIDFQAKAENKIGVIYDLEVAYGGVYQIENMPAENLEQFLNINCPFLLFPFLRRLVADVTREGGFPPLLLDPIDFAKIYEQRTLQAKPTVN